MGFDSLSYTTEVFYGESAAVFYGDSATVYYGESDAMYHGESDAEYYGVSDVMYSGVDNPEVFVTPEELDIPDIDVTDVPPNVVYPEMMLRFHFYVMSTIM